LAVWSCAGGMQRHRRLNEFELPFGYYLERDADLLILRRSDGTFVAAFSALGVDPFEVELMAWQDAD